MRDAEECLGVVVTEFESMATVRASRRVRAAADTDLLLDGEARNVDNGNIAGRFRRVHGVLVMSKGNAFDPEQALDAANHFRCVDIDHVHRRHAGVRNVEPARSRVDG